MKKLMMMLLAILLLLPVVARAEDWIYEEGGVTETISLSSDENDRVVFVHRTDSDKKSAMIFTEESTNIVGGEIRINMGTTAEGVNRKITLVLYEDSGGDEELLRARIIIITPMGEKRVITRKFSKVAKPPSL